MRITSKDTIAGQPALKLRKLLQDFRFSYITPSEASSALGISKPQAKRVLEQMEADGFLEPYAHEKDAWVSTVKGGALAGATAAKPIWRGTAEKAVAALLGRVQALRERSELLYFAAEVLVFGSYLGETDRLGDVDLLIRIEPKEKDRELHRSLSKARIAAVASQGRRFRNLVDELWWPLIEVRQFLRARKAILSIVEESHFHFVWSRPFQVLHVDAGWADRWPGTKMGYVARLPTDPSDRATYPLRVRHPVERGINSGAKVRFRPERPLILDDRLGAEAARFIEEARASEATPSAAASWAGFLSAMEQGGYDAVVLVQAGLQHLAKVDGVGTEPATFLLRPVLLTP